MADEPVKPADTPAPQQDPTPSQEPAPEPTPDANVPYGWLCEPIFLDFLKRALLPYAHT